MALQNNLKEMRNSQGITQESLGKAVGVTRQTIIAIEQGKWEPSVHLALQISRELECDINEIFTLSTEE